FSKPEYWDQLPSLSSELKREDATARLLRRGFPYGFSHGIACSAYTAEYPIPVSGHDRPYHRVQREKCARNYREDEEGKDREPLHARFFEVLLVFNHHVFQCSSSL